MLSLDEKESESQPNAARHPHVHPDAPLDPNRYLS